MKKVIVSGLVVSLMIGMVSMGFCQESKDLQTIKYLSEKKSPGTALLWSLLITGGGQIYNGEMTKGLLMMGGGIVLVATMFKEETTRDEYSWGYVETTETKIRTPQLIGVIGLGIWSMVDAYKGANRYNEKLKEKYGISLLLQENKPTLCLKYSF